MRDRSQPSPSLAPTLPSTAPFASCPTDRPLFDDATLIMRLKPVLVIIWRQRNVTLINSVSSLISCCRREQGKVPASRRWQVEGSEEVCLPVDVLSSRGMTFYVCHDEFACRQQWLLFIHAHLHTHNTNEAMNCALLKNFPWILLYFFAVVILFCFVCNMLSLLPAAFINNYFVVLATSRVFSLSATATHSPGRGAAKGCTEVGPVEFSGLVVWHRHNHVRPADCVWGQSLCPCSLVYN